MNHLFSETSPYLKQHVNNPVDWYPWCEDAFARAQAENKPIFLSIGYSTCHWCHVMAHESFENEEIARILNTHFISIKVDREERPDIDSVYMNVCQAFTGHGGWPMSIFMTWDKKPFFAGTYFPPQAKNGQLGFAYVAAAVAKRWESQPDEVMKSAAELVDILKRAQQEAAPMAEDTLMVDALQIFRKRYDVKNGGFGNAPKFPMPHELLFLLMQKDPEYIDMAAKTLLQMRKGGIYDQIGYGFARYSTDEKWLVPHFEKMLYDNALLIIAYTAAYVCTGVELYRETAIQTAEYVLREMRAPEGGFYSAQDADSEGVEGKYYTFTLDEICAMLGAIQGEKFVKAYDITEQGNYEGRNIPNRLQCQLPDEDFEEEIRKLYAYRKSRMQLHIDDKILLSWNALMIAAMAMLYRVTLDEQYLKAAVRAQKFIETHMSRGEKLYASWHSGRHSSKGFLDDYAFYTAALMELYNSTLEQQYLEKAERICQTAIQRFAEGEGYALAADMELFMKPKETYDGAIPSGNSVMLYNFVRLWQLTEKIEYRQAAEKQQAFLAKQAQGYPAGYCMFLIAKELYENPPAHVKVVRGDAGVKLPFLANVVVVPESPEYPLLNGKTTYYVCKDRTCRPASNEY